MSELPVSAQLLADVRAGDREALSRLYRQYGDTVYRVAYRLTESSADAQDVTQDVFIALPEAIGSVRSPQSFEQWLKTVAVRTALMKLRWRRRRREVQLSTVGQLAAHPLFRGGIDRLSLERAMGQLPENLRSVFVLKEIEGFSHREIAEILGISQRASESRLHRAREKLRLLLVTE
ncbi:MAG: RNA polymerase sigma factor [Gemmatimonadota bacterium]